MKTQKHVLTDSVFQIFTFTYPLTAGVFAAPQMTSQQFPPFFCSPLPSVTWQTKGLSIPCRPTSFSVGLVYFPFHCSLQDGFGQS